MFDSNEYINSIDSSTEWWKDLPLGFLLRIRAIVSTTILQLVLSGVSYIFSFPHVISALLMVLAIGSAGWLYHFRLSRIRRINSDDALHRLAHDMREKVNDVTSAPTIEMRKCVLDQFHQDLVNNIANYLWSRTDNETCGCILRIAEVKDGQSMYVTVARSKNLSDERAKWSTPEPASSGISGQLLSRSAQGAYLVRDRFEAARCGFWQLTHNDTLKDIKQILTLPVNGYHGGTLQMLGILHITVSRGRLNRSDWLWARAFSDFIGLLFSIVYAPQDSENLEEQYVSTVSK